MDKLKNIKIIFIDVDNTLLDFDGYCRYIMEKGFREFNLKKYNDEMYDIFSKINLSLWEDIEKGVLTFDELEGLRWNETFEALGIDFDGVAFEKYFRKNLFDNAMLIEGAFEMLDYLKDKYILCAASNGPYEQQMNRIKVAGMDDYFKHIFISEKMGAAKPSKEFFEEAFSQINEVLEIKINPFEAAIIGDSLTSDIKGGKDAGMLTIHFNYHNFAEYNETIPDYAIKNLADVKEIL